MDRVRGAAPAVAAVALIALFLPPWVADAKPLVVPPRPGQVGLSAQGQFGAMLPVAGMGEEFGFGPGFAVRLKYRMRYERGIGLSFERQSFDARSDAKFTDPLTGEPLEPGAPTAPAKVTLILSGIDFYQMFGTRTPVTRMLSAGFGLAQVHATLNDRETEYRPDGFYATLGGGVEKFFYRGLAYDLTGRYIAVFEEGKTTHQFQAALGLVFYATY
jgi:hypothetical protein